MVLIGNAPSKTFREQGGHKHIEGHAFVEIYLWLVQWKESPELSSIVSARPPDKRFFPTAASCHAPSDYPATDDPWGAARHDGYDDGDVYRKKPGCVQYAAQPCPSERGVVMPNRRLHSAIQSNPAPAR